jgi:hypothetical protein
MDLLAVDLDLKSSHRGSAWLLVLVHSQPGRTRWHFLSSQLNYTIIRTQPPTSVSRPTSPTFREPEKEWLR